MSDSPIAATTQARIIRRRMLADGILGLTLERIDGEPLAAADAGAHIDLHLPNGLVRQYSLSNAPTGRTYELGVLLDPGGRGGSICVHEDLHEGQVLTIGAPRNLFRLVAGARRSLLVAGGIGITPIISMADTLHAAGKAFELHYCCRSASRAAYRDRLGSAAYADHVRFYYDDAPQDGRLDTDALLASPAKDLDLYVCGPGGFMDHVMGRARAAGWPESNIHAERFSADVADRAGDAFELVLARSGRVLRVATEQSVLDVLREAGVQVPVSCEQGICGTCITRVLEGQPEHRDVFLTEDERACNDRFTPCCSRARSARLVVDL
ncbi:PDR/VanB family oxidoreductase [Solimonas flava]|uniref:Vanillate O-demethylase oxidoreductase n=1 Tax=uncultured bacterium UPO41 TaxID=1776966 RepID=A0A126SXU4_9BACT|nr:PDR/VanB family oxidoreductase [Solimonas flava]AMK59130.1 vanillate O-demethylase oxidoreductase [uncultured bacterium UPO41]